MSRISEIRLKETAQCYTVSIRKTISFMNEYSEFFKDALSLVSACLDEHDVLTSSPPVVCFHNMDLEQLDVEVGFHTAQDVTSNETISCKSCQPCKVVTTIDMGPYEKQDPTLMELFDYIKLHDLEMQGPIIYYYLNEPERAESEYLTQMVIPVK